MRAGWRAGGLAGWRAGWRAGGRAEQAWESYPDETPPVMRLKVISEKKDTAAPAAMLNFVINTTYHLQRKWSLRQAHHRLVLT
ncbi:hypothetical protein DPMN_109579 [Dreissena polymorpha]|uniref:Uncharacterized protein n=1 Tax=Dreissena polymorpha TaxID=45954 RepID=A0A9D4KB19_DREPO|nr:hypothetical protein DPMN_109579 [Dreissena polymorpha]